MSTSIKGSAAAARDTRGAVAEVEGIGAAVCRLDLLNDANASTTGPVEAHEMTSPINAFTNVKRGSTKVTRACNSQFGRERDGGGAGNRVRVSEPVSRQAGLKYLDLQELLRLQAVPRTGEHW